MPTWVIFWVIFVAIAAILKMPPLCQKSRLARLFIFVFFSSYTTTILKRKKIGEMSLPGFGTLSQKVGLKRIRKKTKFIS